MTGFNSFQSKQYVQKISHLNELGSKFDLDLLGLCQPRIIVWTNLVYPTSPMLHTKSQGHWPSGSGEDSSRVFTIYGRGSHLGNVTRTIWTNFRSRVLRSLRMKFEFNWPSGIRGEDAWKCWLMDGRRSYWYTISSPMNYKACKNAK